ncbi:MAG: 23S rRNA (uracil(1939)-C(5))-methyltransferase RlmD [Clostridiales bacterium]|nr:MAG: 23S rRNA (uracil(1939)-C(5))-methyltransferase RlmD [Clostridiales bacterium]
MRENKVSLNEILKLNIQDLTSESEGVAKINNFTVFVASSIPGDVVKAKVYLVKKNYAKAKLLEIITPSEHRVESTYSNEGSELIIMDYNATLNWKKRHVEKTIEKIAKIRLEVEEIIPSTPRTGYRNKCTYPVRDSKIGVFYKGTHDICEIDFSPNNNPELDEIMRLIRSKLDYVSTYNEKTNAGSLRHVVVRKSSLGEMMVVLVIKEDSDLSPIVDELKNYGVDTVLINYNRKKTNLITGRIYKTVYGSGYIKEKIGKSYYLLGPDSFFQVNHQIMIKIYNEVRKYIKKIQPNVVFDLYSGMGTIASHISDLVDRVYAIEVNEEAVTRGKLSAKENNIENIIFIKGKSEEKIREIKDTPDLVIVDPPRKGLDKSLIDSIIKSRVKHVIYVSCKPSTLARDLKVFSDNGYEAKELKCYDMFANTGHVECIIMMSRN